MCALNIQLKPSRVYVIGQWEATNKDALKLRDVEGKQTTYSIPNEV